MNAKDLLIYQAYAGEASSSPEPEPSVTVEPLEVTENGEYTASEGTAYSPVTVDVPTGGGGVSEDDDVLFIDYDGTILYSYSAEDFLALTEMPANPEHDGLVAQGWNWSLADAQEYVRDYGMQVIGQMYVTESGATEIDIELDEWLTPTCTFGVNGTATIDWGDGSTPDEVVGTNVNTAIATTHEYALPGEYCIKIKATSGEVALVGGNLYGGCPLLNGGGNTGATINRRYWRAIKAVRVGDVSNIYMEEFEYADNLEYITMPIVSISRTYMLMHACASLKAVILPPGCSEAESSSFRNLNAEYISIPKSVNVVAGLQESLFKRVIMPATVQRVNTLQKCRALQTVIAPGATEIAQYAFQDCGALKKVRFSTIAKLEDYAFSGCGLMQGGVDLGAVTRIPQSAFYSCKNMDNIVIPNTVTRIDGSAFYQCYGLASLEIPESVTQIGSSAFYQCFSLKTLRFCGATPPTLSSNAFGYLPTDCIIEVPAGTLSAYTSAANYPDPNTYTYREFTE